ncbi:hypothetical protein [Roseisolibacter agri]|uniref:Uncharacterized protein n=1 Tax=Roseisolibacter agri TaxID=2014610 RepID=A0AA37Q3C8_9BACT|nr:hypothetical protein [Roseisolibacter agri]GLC25834.1 hypothetical protein rosag_23470 [Roseisolibacter agri]
MRPVSDRQVYPIALAGTRAVPPASPYAARAYGEATRVGERQSPAPRDRRPETAAADAGRALLAARPAAPGVETEVSIRMYADGGSISVVRHLRGGETVGIEALIR